MELSKTIDKIMLGFIFVVVSLVVCSMMTFQYNKTFAEGDETAAVFETDGPKYVTFFDGDEKLTVKTDAKTVREALSRAEIEISDGDIVEPGLDAEINADNYYINIHRGKPVIVRDGIHEKYFMTASTEPKTIAKEAGLTVYDGDEVKIVPNLDFLQAGVATVYEISRNGGRTITEEVEIPFTEETVKDVALEKGKSEVKQLGEVGRKKVYYEVQYVDNVEVSRELKSEEVVKEPVARVVAVGAKPAMRPNSETCAQWAREAGVSEADLAAAIDIIYRESGCRVDAQNPSGAYGIPQALPGSKMASAGADWETNPVTQIRWMAGYVSRYGGWQGALEFWYAHGWY